MPVKATPRFIFLLITCSVLLGIIFVTSFRYQPQGTRDPARGTIEEGRNGHRPLMEIEEEVDMTMVKSGSIMPKLGNETAKAELGRATWKYFHTVMARFPDKPTQEESTTLSSYIQLFQRLYPCGECADHFGEILKRFPPQVSSRIAAATWACHVHNEVNKSLSKDLFDCANIGDFYDCGCADDKNKTAGGTTTRQGIS
ncbi:hypothetical protein AMS68_005768 [Peltaster fructicola]|uniref:Sulfhydryl oxidase n=1 Tax=Peltaster fructicola TaxID=286661 RepID=A0A6H0Y007_9PEZI|nr:hypothetical protein AMS68_005768 [Peltaster fructicola]